MKLKDVKHLCGICSKRLLPLDDVEIDHIIPRALGRIEQPWNKRIVHKVCNRAKGATLESIQLPMLLVSHASNRFLGHRLQVDIIVEAREHDQEVLKARESGWTFERIAQTLGISRQRAHQRWKRVTAARRLRAAGRL